MSLYLSNGAPIGIPRDLASLDREMTQPSLLDSTTTGFPHKLGSSTCSHDTKKLLASISAIIRMLSTKTDTPMDVADPVDTFLLLKDHTKTLP